MCPGESKSSPRRIRAAERHRQALALRLNGESFARIATLLGYKDSSGAYLAVEAALKRVPAAEAASYRKLNIERLNEMRLEARVLEGSKRIEYEIKIQEREARYLGLDAPSRTEVTGKDGEPLLTFTLIPRPPRIEDSTEEIK